MGETEVPMMTCSWARDEGRAALLGSAAVIAIMIPHAAESRKGRLAFLMLARAAARRAASRRGASGRGTRSRCGWS